jgi:uncharacterized membrane protein YoaK (UPF0700 family)
MDWPAPATARRDLMILLLAIAGGSVDAVIYLVFGVFTAAQTGNTIILALSLAQVHLATVLRSATSLVAFVVGVALAEHVILQVRDENRTTTLWPSTVNWALGVELVCLGVLLVYWYLAGPQLAQVTIAILVALAGIAMGIQSAAVLRLRVAVTTTYITGLPTYFTIGLIRRLRDVETTPDPSSTRQEARPSGMQAGRGPWIYLITWLVYAAGAVVSGLLYLRVGELALILPIAAILAVVLAEARH